MNWSLHRAIALFGHLTFFVLALLAIVLYKERLFVDATYYFFKAINSGGFHVEHGRIVLALSQIVPLLVYYLGFPLKLIMIAGSLNHELFFYFLFLWCIYGFRSQSAALSVILIHLIGQNWLFYVPMVEIYYGAGLAVIYFLILNTHRAKDDKWLFILLLLQWFIMTSHPLNYILLLFIGLTHYFKNGLDLKLHGSISAFFFVGIYTLLFAADSYESNKIAGMASNNGYLSNLLDATYTWQLIKYLVVYYYEAFILLCISLVYLFKKHLKWTALVIVGCVLLDILQANYRGESNTDTWYMEVMYAPLVSISVLAFFFLVYRELNLQYRKLSVGLIMLLVGFRIVWIWNAGEDLRARVYQMEYFVDQVQEKEGSKFLYEEANYARDYSMVTWANPVDFLMFSAIDGPDKAVNLPTAGEFLYERNYQFLNDSNFIFRRFEIHPISFLNPKLFRLEDGPYQRLNSSVDSVNTSSFVDNVHVNLEHSKKEFTVSDSTYLPIKIYNLSGFTVPSIPIEQVHLSYDWLAEDGKVINLKDTTSLIMDVEGELFQDLHIIFPDEVGNYQLKPKLILKGVLLNPEASLYDFKVKN